MNYSIPLFSDLGIHTLKAIVTDGVPGHDSDTVSWNIEVIDNAIRLSLNVLLEGPFEGLQMNTVLNEEEVIPLAQPYYENPWLYFGIEEVVSIPGIHIVDWLLIELREDSRKNKDYSTADKIRNKLDEIGITLEDRKGETLWRRD